MEADEDRSHSLVTACFDRIDDFVVSGSIRGVGTRLRVTAELSDVDTDSRILS